MAERSRFGSGELLRPLLRNGRNELQGYALENRLQWIEDPSNLDVHLRRNFVRHEVLSRLARNWPDVASKLARSAQHAADAQLLLDDLARIDLGTCELPYEPQHLGGLSVVALGNLAEHRQRNALRMWLKKKGYLPPSDAHLNTLLEQIRRPSRSRRACVSWPGVEVWRYRDLLVAVPALPAADEHLDVPWDLRTVLDIPGVGQLRAEPVNGRGLVPARLKGSLHVRLRQGGERCVLPGRKHHHLLKKLLQAASVPPWERARLPLFYAGNELVAVADRWTCAPFAAGPDEVGLVILWHPFARALQTGRKSEKSC
jgi:tRNA(Ile)-lysidine synthase